MRDPLAFARPVAGRLGFRGVGSARPSLPDAPGTFAPTGTAEDLVYQPGGEFTVGAEDELMLVDAKGQLLGADAGPLMAAMLDESSAEGTVTGEIFVDQVELGTPVCSSAEEVADALAAQRRWLAEHGARVMAVGVHPQAEFGTARTVTSNRYDPIVTEFAGLFRTPTAAFQVHVGLPDEQTAIVAYRGLRNRLALFRALGAASPFWHGRDSGLVSARSAILRSYPRATLPPALRSWDDYVRVTERILAAEELPDYTYVWWGVRPQPRLGTLEVRVMDAQHSLSTIAGLTALVQGLARHVVASPDPDDLPEEVLAANDQRACRYGLDTGVVDVDGARHALRDLATRALAHARQALAPDGLDAPLDVVESMLAAPCEAHRQRLLRAHHGMPALLADLATRTAANP